ncbi:MAG TPA: hypothetical protein PLS46_02695 [Microthrixaceae bacterium]|nr:hypothetical protein [Microthrixaceae bacterium]
MDFLLELLLEILFEGLLDGGFDLVGRGIARVIKVRAIRILLLVGIVVAIGIVGGYFWGRYAAEQLGGGTPRTLWVSLASGVVALVLAAGLHRSDDDRFAHTPGREPRTWPQRLFAIGAFNLVTAAGIAWGAAAV